MCTCPHWLWSCMHLDQLQPCITQLHSNAHHNLNPGYFKAAALLNATSLFYTTACLLTSNWHISRTSGHAVSLMCRAKNAWRPGFLQVGPDITADYISGLVRAVLRLFSIRLWNRAVALCVCDITSWILMNINHQNQRYPAAAIGNLHLKSVSSDEKCSAPLQESTLLSTKAIKTQPLPSPHCAASPVLRAYQMLPDLEEIWPAPPKPRRSTRRGANERRSCLASLQLHLYSHVSIVHPARSWAFSLLRHGLGCQALNGAGDAAVCVGFALFLLSDAEREARYVSLCWS